MKNIFTRHPHSVGESYFQHMYFAMRFGIKMILGGLAAIVHAIFPFLFEKTASDTTIHLVNEFAERMPVVDDRLVVLVDLVQKKRVER